MAVENAHLKRMQPASSAETLPRKDMEELLLEMFDFIVVLKSIETTGSHSGLLEVLFQKSEDLIRKLNPLVDKNEDILFFLFLKTSINSNPLNLTTMPSAYHRNQAVSPLRYEG